MDPQTALYEALDALHNGDREIADAVRLSLYQFRDWYGAESVFSTQRVATCAMCSASAARHHLHHLNRDGIASLHVSGRRLYWRLSDAAANSQQKEG